MKRSKIADERVQAQTHQFGFQARIFMSSLLALDLMGKIFILKQEPSYWVTEALIFVAGFSWYIIRCAFAGLFILPENSTQKKRLKLQMILTGIILGLIFAITFIAFYQPIQQQGFTQILLFILLVLGVLLAVYFSIIWILVRISLQSLKNKMEE